MILKHTATFQVLFIVSLFCAWNNTTVEINSGVHLLKNLFRQVPPFVYFRWSRSLSFYFSLGLTSLNMPWLSWRIVLAVSWCYGNGLRRYLRFRTVQTIQEQTGSTNFLKIIFVWSGRGMFLSLSNASVQSSTENSPVVLYILENVVPNFPTGRITERLRFKFQ